MRPTRQGPGMAGVNQIDNCALRTSLCANHTPPVGVDRETCFELMGTAQGCVNEEYGDEVLELMRTRSMRSTAQRGAETADAEGGVPAGPSYSSHVKGGVLPIDSSHAFSRFSLLAMKSLNVLSVHWPCSGHTRRGPL